MFEGRRNEGYKEHKRGKHEESSGKERSRNGPPLVLLAPPLERHEAWSSLESEEEMVVLESVSLRVDGGEIEEEEEEEGEDDRRRR